MKTASNVAALARELGIRRKFLYLWRDQAMKAAGYGKPRKSRGKTSESERLRNRIEELLQLVGQQEAKLVFFESALRRVAERQQHSDGNGATGSTTPSGR